MVHSAQDVLGLRGPRKPPYKGVVPKMNVAHEWLSETRVKVSWLLKNISLAFLLLVFLVVELQKNENLLLPVTQLFNQVKSERVLGPGSQEASENVFGLL